MEKVRGKSQAARRESAMRGLRDRPSQEHAQMFIQKRKLTNPMGEVKSDTVCAKSL